LFNRAISGRFPPGSIFKTMTALAALKTKKISRQTTYNCTGRLHIGNRDFKCWATHGLQDFFHAVAHSCDVYFYQLGLVAGADGLANMAHEFGLASPTGIDLPQEASGFIPSRLWKRLVHFEGWYDGDTANFSIGQGYVLVTPLQLARLMAAVANGGYLVEPHLTKAIGGVDVAVRPAKRIKVSKEDLDLLREALRYSVQMEDGTAHNLDIAGLEICAKTGTAQIHNGVSHGWVAGFFPFHAPRFAFCILLENAGTSHAACELGRQLFEEVSKREKFN
jgi:penicillin-binding protein 2